MPLYIFITGFHQNAMAYKYIDARQRRKNNRAFFTQKASLARKMSQDDAI